MDGQLVMLGFGGTVFYSEAAAKASNEEFNEKIKKAIELQKTDYEDAVKKENKSFKKDLKEIKEGKWKGMTEKLKSQESDDHETLKSGNKKADESSLDKTQAKTLKKVKVEKKPDKTDKKEKNVKKQEIKQKKTSDSEKKISKKEKTTEDIELRTEIHERTLRDLKRQKKKSINKLKKEFIDDNAITKQIGHVGIYAGKDKDGNDTWIHCTGGSIDNVVLTTENEYDGFQYFYSPFENKRKNVSAGNFLDGTKVIKLPELEGYNGKKTYEPYTTITSVNSWQYKLQQKAYTNEDGFRMINGRYMIATGSGVSHDIGRYIDIVRFSVPFRSDSGNDVHGLFYDGYPGRTFYQ